MKKIMAAAFALCMLGSVAFAQGAPATSSKQATKKEAKASKSEHHVVKTSKKKKHHHAKKVANVKHGKTHKKSSAKTKA